MLKGFSHTHIHTQIYTFSILMKKRIVPNHCSKNSNLRLNQEIINLFNRTVVADMRERV